MTITRPHVETARRYLTYLSLAVTIFGLVISPPFISVGLISLFILGVFDPLRGINPRWWSGVGEVVRSGWFWGFVGLYLVLVLGVWQTEDWGYYLERLRVKVPLAALPLAWPGLPRLTRKDVGWVWGGTAVFLLLVLTGVMINYGLHFEEINGMIERGQAVPVPRNHIRFSLLVACATLLGYGAYRLRAGGVGWPWLVVVGLLFVGQHFLAVRSGLLGAYAGAGVGIFMEQGVRKRRWLLVAGTLAALCVLPLLAYVAVPSFRAKFDYARYELLHRDRSIDTAEYSDEGRFTSWRVGLDVWREHPWLGVGPGNLRAATDARYAEVLPGVEGKRPHNQFLSALAGSGVVGLLVNLLCFGLLLAHGLRHRLSVFVAVWSVLTISCLVENTLENTVGVSLFVLGLLLTAFTARDRGAVQTP